MIATFSPPIKATAKIDSLPRVIIATASIVDKIVLMTVNMDGEIGFYEPDELLVDWRYDPKSGIWGDIGEEPEEGSDGGDAEA